MDKSMKMVLAFGVVFFLALMFGVDKMLLPLMGFLGANASMATTVVVGILAGYVSVEVSKWL